jgi:hypothetical protein
VASALNHYSPTQLIGFARLDPDLSGEVFTYVGCGWTSGTTGRLPR